MSFPPGAAAPAQSRTGGNPLGAVRGQHPTRRLTPRRRRPNKVWLIGAVAVTVACLALADAWIPTVFAKGPTKAEEGVFNPSAEFDLSGWKASSDIGQVVLHRVQIPDGPAGSTTAVDLRRDGGAGRWAMALTELRRPTTFFTVGRTYRMQVWVRDLNASGQSAGVLLANSNYQHRPTVRYRFDSYRDDGWHLLTRTFVCTAAGFADTALYLSLPTSGSLHWQVTAASVQEVEPLRPARVESPPATVLSFDGPAGAPPNPLQWNYELGGGGWGNDELQTYTASTVNSRLDGNGNLVVTARREKLTGSDGIARDFTSARITTQGKIEVRPGSYVEAAIRAPVGAGVWPAFWLVGSNIDRVGWPSAGELDVLEVTGGKETAFHSWMHMAAQGDPKQDMPSDGGAEAEEVDLGHRLDSQTHLYGVYFDGSMVRFYVDHREHLAYNADDALASGRSWPFGQPFYLVLNVAVGGAGGNPSATSFPKSMTVGPISIWQGGTPF